MEAASATHASVLAGLVHTSRAGASSQAGVRLSRRKEAPSEVPGGFVSLQMVLVLMPCAPSPGPLFSSGGQPAPCGSQASWTKSQNPDPFADLGDLSSGLQGNVEGTLGVWKLFPCRRFILVCLTLSCPK